MYVRKKNGKLVKITTWADVLMEQQAQVQVSVGGGGAGGDGGGGGASGPVSYLFYQLNITVWNDPVGYRGCGEWALYDDVTNLGNVTTANGQLNVTGETGTITANKAGLAGALIAEAANGDTTDGFIATNIGSEVEWIRFEFTVKPANPVLAYSIWSANAAVRYPNSWTFEGSDDGIAWTVLDTRSGETATLGQQQHDFVIP